VDWEADPNWEFRTAADLAPEQVRQRYREACDRSRRVVSEMTDLDQLSVQPLDVCACRGWDNATAPGRGAAARIWTNTGAAPRASDQFIAIRAHRAGPATAAERAQALRCR
jgi:hypothetical protein